MTIEFNMSFSEALLRLEDGFIIACGVLPNRLYKLDGKIIKTKLISERDRDYSRCELDVPYCLKLNWGIYIEPEKVWLNENYPDNLGYEAVKNFATELKKLIALEEYDSKSLSNDDGCCGFNEGLETAVKCINKLIGE